MRTALLIVGAIAVVLCIACGVGLYFFGLGTLQGVQAISQTGDRFLTALQKGDFKTATQLIDPTARATYTEAELRKRWGILENAIGKVRSWSIQDSDIVVFPTEYFGTLKMLVQGDKGSGIVEFTLKHEGERWLIKELRFGW